MHRPICAPRTRRLLALAVAPATLALAAASAAPAATLSWNNAGGTGNGTTWDIGVNQNWQDTTTLAPAVYTDGDAVTFTDANNSTLPGDSRYTVSIPASVNPSSF